MTLTTNQTLSTIIKSAIKVRSLWNRIKCLNPPRNMGEAKKVRHLQHDSTDESQSKRLWTPASLGNKSSFTGPFGNGIYLFDHACEKQLFWILRGPIHASMLDSIEINWLAVKPSNYITSIMPTPTKCYPNNEPCSLHGDKFLFLCRVKGKS